MSYIVPQNMFWILLFIGFFIASFLTYLHDIEGKRNKQGKRTIREMLVGLLTEGESIRDSGIIEPKDEVREWANRVRFYIFENLGASHAARFMSNDGLGKVDCQMTAAFLTYRLMRIQQLLMEFKRKSVLDKEDSQT